MEEELSEAQEQLLSEILKAAPRTQIFQIHPTGKLIINGADVNMNCGEIDIMTVKNFLVNEGFAELTEKANNQSSVSFNERGQKLHKAGSLETLLLNEEAESKAEEERRRLEGLMISTNITTGKIQSSLLSLNRWIAVATCVAAVYYLLEIALEMKRYCLHGCYPDWQIWGVLLLGVLLGIAALILLLPLLERMRRKK